jgi:RNA recognition motif-containing protein
LLSTVVRIVLYANAYTDIQTGNNVIKYIMSGKITNLFVSMRGAAFDMEQGDLESIITEIFSAYGEVSKVNIIIDRETNQPRGFGFVEMDADGAQKAIDELDGTTTDDGLELGVNVARPKEDRGGSFGGGRKSFGGGNRNGGSSGGYNRDRNDGGGKRDRY